MSYGQSWGLKQGPRLKSTAVSFYFQVRKKKAVLLEIDQVPCRPTTGHRGCPLNSAGPQLLCILPPSPASLTGSPRTGGIRTKRQTVETLCPFQSQFMYLRFLLVRTQNLWLYTGLHLWNRFYLNWQLVSLSPIVDWVKLSFTGLSGPFFCSLVYGYESLWGKASFLIPASGII